jgi:hypothetical protein
MKYTQSQWDREIGWGKVPEKYKAKTKIGISKLEEYKSKINYDVWADVSNVKYNMKVNYNVQSQDSESTRTDNRNDKS